MSGVIGTGTGLQGEYYNNQDLTNLAVTRNDPMVNFNWSHVTPDPSIQKDTFSVRWQGEVQAEYSQAYTFLTTSDGGVRLWVNGRLLINNWNNHATKQNQARMTLQAGQAYNIEMDYSHAYGNSVAKLSWSSRSQKKQIIPSSQLYPPGSSGSASAGSENITGIGETSVPPIPGNWSSIFDDNFTGSSLSPAWSNSMWEKAYAGTANVSNGTLELSATNASTPMLINTENSRQPFSFTYGYAQVTMQAPKGQGVWPAFWMLPLQSASPDSSAGEIDVYEGQGSLPTMDFATYLWGKPTQRIQSSYDAGANLSQEYHTFGVDWEPDHITWYLDGKPFQTVTSAQAKIDGDPMYLILDVWLGGWNGQPNASTPFPATANVQSVQVWQEAGT